MRQQTQETERVVRCTAWKDPGTGRINVTFVQDVGDGSIAVATDHSCVTRALLYDHELSEDEPEPSPVTASLDRNEAIALLDALDALELVDRRPMAVSRHRPAPAADGVRVSAGDGGAS